VQSVKSQIVSVSVDLTLFIGLHLQFNSRRYPPDADCKLTGRDNGSSSWTVLFSGIAASTRVGSDRMKLLSTH